MSQVEEAQAEPITSAVFLRLIDALGDQARDDIDWAEALCLPADPDEFAREIIFVICNSGMKNTVARRIYEKCCAALTVGASATQVFGHKGKAVAIDTVWRDRVHLLEAFLSAPDRLAYCETLPWIGGITKYHLAKNFGVDCAKPDVHLQRLADRAGVTPQQLCEALAKETGYRVATIDTILWRACANGILNSRTGAIHG